MSIPPPPAISLSAIKNNLNNLQGVSQRHGLTFIAEKITGKLRDLSTPPEVLVFVVGEGNFGKSSLLNAVMGKPVAPVSFLPKTWKIDLYSCVPASENEYATVRFRNTDAVARMSIEEAKQLCEAQEAEITEAMKRRCDELNAECEREGLPKVLKSDVSVDPLENQITEVRWHYHGLALPPNIVLVDTPGFKQLRGGMNQSRTGTLSGTQGIVFDMEDISEQYYHRATLVLWVLRADKLNDKDTLEEFNNRLSRGKQLLAAITYTDKVEPAKRETELLPQARKHFGHGLQSFMLTVSYEKSPEHGLGIPELRAALAGLSPSAERLRLEEMAHFCTVEARDATKQVTALGNNLIHNLMQLSLYCNATSNKLLTDTYSRYVELHDLFRERLFGGQGEGLDAAHQRAIVQLMREVANHESIQYAVFGVSHEQKENLARIFREWLEQMLHLPALNDAFQDRLRRIGEHVRSEARQFASSYKARQLVIQSDGRFKEVPLPTRIDLPDISRLTVSLPGVTMPPLPGGFFNNLARLFGGASIDEATAIDTVSAVDREAKRMAEGLQPMMSEYVRSVAERILLSADTAVSELYPDESFDRLHKRSGRVDADLLILDALTRTSSEEQRAPYRYDTLFRIWSPRDDTRLAALDLLTQWFETKWGGLKREAGNIIEQTGNHGARFAPGYTSSVWLSRIRDSKSPVREQGLPQNVFADSVRGAVSQRWKPFDDDKVATQVLENFGHLNLSGLCAAFASDRAKVFHRHWLNRRREPEIDSIKPTYCVNKIGAYLASGAPATAAVLIVDSSLLGSAFVADSALFALGLNGIAILGTTIPVYFLMKRYEKRKQQQEVAERIAAQWEAHDEQIMASCWQETIASTTVQDFRHVAGKATLVEPCPLDYAMEGVFSLKGESR